MPPTSPRPLAGALALSLSLLFLAGPPPGSAQKPAQKAESDSTFFEQVDVDVVNVEVFVTGRDGNPVAGLTRDDFEVFDDGKKVEITHFHAAEGSAAESPAEPVPGVPGLPAAAGTPASAAPAAPQGLHLAVFFDNESLNDRLRLAAQESLRSFLPSHLGPRDTLLVVRYDGRGRVSLFPVAPGDAAALDAAFREVNASPTQSQLRNAELRELVRQIEIAPGWEESAQRLGADNALSDAWSTLERVRDFTKKRYNEVERTLAALEGVTRTMAPLPGRKALVLVSGGLPLIPGLTAAASWQNKYGSRGILRGAHATLEAVTVDTSFLFKKLTDAANASGVTFYALGSPNEADGFSAEFSHRTWRRGHGRADRDQFLQSMMMASVPTGGMADTDSIEPDIFLKKVSRDLGSYYSLGFAPAPRPRGRKAEEARPLQVRVKRPGLEVRHRQSYRPQDAPERMRSRVLSALLLSPPAGGGEPDNPLGVHLALDQESPAKGAVEVDLLVTLPMSSLTLLPRDRTHEGRVMVYLASRDDHGQVSEVTQVAVPVRVPEGQLAAALQQAMAYRTRLRLRRSPHTIAVGVRDELSQVAATALVRYTPGEAPAGPR